jgi:hypothetical protein
MMVVGHIGEEADELQKNPGNECADEAYDDCERTNGKNVPRSCEIPKLFEGRLAMGMGISHAHRRLPRSGVE